MPFTFSHPAVVLPFRLLPKSWFSLSGLIIGSIVPDFEKFINMEPGNTLSHTKAGVFLFNLPLGILLFFLFHSIVRDSLISNLPFFLESRFKHIEKLNWAKHFKKQYFKISISIIVGTVLHIGWDSMTHKNGLIVRLFPHLTHTIIVGNYEQPFYNLLDIISTVLGGLFIMYKVMNLPTSKIIAREYSMKCTFWLIVGVVSFSVVVLRVLAGLGDQWHWDVIISSISAFLIGIVVASVVVRYNNGYVRDNSI